MSYAYTNKIRRPFFDRKVKRMDVTVYNSLIFYTKVSSVFTYCHVVVRY